VSRRTLAPLLVALALVLAGAAAARAQAPPAGPPLKATIVLGQGAPADGVFPAGVPVPIVVQIENVSGADVATTEGFSSTDFFRRLYFVDPQGGIVTNKVEEQIHTDSRVFMCLSRRGALQRPAIPVAPIEVLVGTGPGAPGNFFREYEIDDARRFYDLSRPGRYSVTARIPLLVFTLSDPAAVIDDCDQLPGLVAANVAALTGRAEFTIVSNTLEFEVDSLPPQPPATTATAAPAPGPSGWTRQSVTVSFTATSPSNIPIQRIVIQTSGAQPGVQDLSGTKGSVTITADGQTSVAFHAEDIAGNIEATQVLTVKVDGTQPIVTCEAPDTGWHATDVTLACTAQDPASGLANTSDASFSLATAVPAGTETDAATTDGRTVCDVAGNCVTKTVGGIKVDKKAPAMTLTSPTPDAVYDVGQVVLAGYGCTDGGSGLVACAGPVASGAAIDTATPGVTTFTVNAMDAVGNASSASVTYRVGSQDTTPPVLTVPSSVTVDATSPAGALVTYAVSATDDVTPSPTVACAPVSGSTFPIGTTTVSCTATDAAGNTTSKSFSVIVQAAAAQVANLMDTVRSFNLKQGITNSLDAKLQNVEDALTSAKKGSVTSTCNQMSAFINETKAQSGKALTVDQATQLQSAATRIRAVIGCP